MVQSEPYITNNYIIEIWGILVDGCNCVSILSIPYTLVNNYDVLINFAVSEKKIN